MSKSLQCCLREPKLAEPSLVRWQGLARSTLSGVDLVRPLVETYPTEAPAQVGGVHAGRRASSNKTMGEDR
jgi:hypothetical protein